MYKCPKCGTVAEHEKILIKKEVCADYLIYIGRRCIKCGCEWAIELLEEDKTEQKPSPKQPDTPKNKQQP